MGHSTGLRSRGGLTIYTQYGLLWIDRTVDQRALFHAVTGEIIFYEHWPSGAGDWAFPRMGLGVTAAELIDYLASARGGYILGEVEYG